MVNPEQIRISYVKLVPVMDRLMMKKNQPARLTQIGQSHTTLRTEDFLASAQSLIEFERKSGTYHRALSEDSADGPYAGAPEIIKSSLEELKNGMSVRYKPTQTLNEASGKVHGPEHTVNTLPLNQRKE